MAQKSLTGRELIRQILNCNDIDAPVIAMNINAGDDEFSGDDENSNSSQEVISMADNTEGGAGIVLYYLGDVPPEEED